MNEILKFVNDRPWLLLILIIVLACIIGISCSTTIDDIKPDEPPLWLSMLNMACTTIGWMCVIVLCAMYGDIVKNILSVGWCIFKWLFSVIAGGVALIFLIAVAINLLDHRSNRNTKTKNDTK